MKTTYMKHAAIVILFLQLAGINKVYAQIPTPQISNVSTCIQLAAPGNNGTILIVPNLINRLNTVSWALVLPGDTDRTHVNWQSVTCKPADDSSAIIALINKGGAGNEGKFYVLYQDGALALDTVSATGPGTPVVVNDSISNYYQLAGQNTLYLVTTQGYLYESTDDGQTWQADTVNASDNGFIAVALDTFQNVYALYSPGGTSVLYKQDAHAIGWHPVSAFPTGKIITSLFTDRRGYIFVGTYLSGVYCSKDTGNTFTASNTIFSAGTTQQFCDDAFGNMYMIANGGNQLFRSSDTGNTWGSIGSPIVEVNSDSGNYSVNGYVINNIAGDSVLTVSTIYGMFVSHDQGNTWAPVNRGLHETQFNGFYKSPAGRYVEISNNGVFYIDPGNSVFTHSYPVNGYGYTGPVYADTLGNIYWRELVPYNGDYISAFWKSADYGATWLADTFSSVAGIAVSGFGVDEYGNLHFGAYYNGIHVYNKNPGGSFAIDTAGMDNVLDDYYTINAFTSDDNGSLFMGGGGNASPLTCWRRPVNGGTWTLDTAGLPYRAPVTFLTRDTSHNMIALTDGQVYYRQAGVWTALDLPAAAAPGTGNVAAVAADNTGGILIAIAPALNYGGYGVYCTHDLGASWNYVGLNGINVYALYSFGDTTYALSDWGIYALTCNGVVESIAQNELENTNNNLSLYPNPAQNECNAVFTLPASSSINQLDIVDVCGNTLKSISIPTGFNALNFNTGNMSCGIYFCVLKSGEMIVDVKRLVVVK